MSVVKEQIYCICYMFFIYIVSAWYALLQFIEPHRKPKVYYQQDDKIALITGGGKGIGFETSQQLLEAGMTVVIVGIEEHQEEGVGCLRKNYKERVIFLECDLSSLKSVKQLVSKFEEMNLPLHLLINNAGIMFAPRHVTKEGFESHWVINYLSHFLLTHLLMKTLIKSATATKPSRVVNVGSCLHNQGTINFIDTQGRVRYSPEAAYAQSKLAMVMFSSALARRLRRQTTNVLVNSVHPGVAFTNLYQYSWLPQCMSSVMKLILKTPAQASDTVIYAAISEEVTDGGNYIDNCKIKTPSPEAQSELVQQKLWALSCTQTGITEFGY